MRTIQGPALFLAQFIAPEPPYDRLETLADWAAGMGYRGLQIPTFPRVRPQHAGGGARRGEEPADPRPQ